MTYKELLENAETQLTEKKLEVSVAKFLLMGLTNMHSYQLISMLDEKMDSALASSFEQGIQAYLKGKPLQYILGYEEFFSRKFIVDESVLIPRFETEELVEQTLYRLEEFFEDTASISLVDVGTGSGAIAITLQLEDTRLEVMATDYSNDALVTAKENAKRLGAKVGFLQGDMLEPLISEQMQFDCLVSNPPYIPESEIVQDIVLNNEPHLALFGGADGTYFYERIFEKAKQVLNEKALLAFEIGDQHSSKLVKLAEYYLPEFEIEIVKDLQGKERMMFLTRS